MSLAVCQSHASTVFTDCHHINLPAGRHGCMHPATAQHASAQSQQPVSHIGQAPHVPRQVMQNLGSIQGVCACMAALMQGGLGSHSNRPGAARGLPDPEPAEAASATAPGEDAANEHSKEAADESAAEPGPESAAGGRAVLLPLRVSVKASVVSVVGRLNCLLCLWGLKVTCRAGTQVFARPDSHAGKLSRGGPVFVGHAQWPARMQKSCLRAQSAVGKGLARLVQLAHWCEDHCAQRARVAGPFAVPRRALSL